jgi:rod shape-determining protein MreC
LGAYQEGVMRARVGAGQSWVGLTQGARLADDCARLTRENDALRAQVDKLDAAGRENARLRRLLDLGRDARRPVVACEVIAREDGYGWWQTVRLNKGRDAGLHADMAVITAGGLVGKTHEVSASSSDVLLIADRTVKVAVRFEPSGAYGVLRGGGVSAAGRYQLEILFNPRPFQVEYLSKELAIQPGEKVVTSGLGGVFPANIPVGVVRRVWPDETGLYQHAEVLPAADLSRLQEVLVVVGADRRAVPAGEEP